MTNSKAVTLVAPFRSATIRAFAVVMCLFVGQQASAMQQRGDTSAAAAGSTLVPLPVIFYQPETGTGFGGLATYYVPLSQGRAGRIQPSAFSVIGIYTVKKQIITYLSADMYLQQGRLRVRSETGYSKFPTKFWGIGNDTRDRAEEDYTPGSVVLNAEAYREVSPGWYVGAALRVAHRELLAVEPGGLLDAGAVDGVADGTILGLGVGVTRDTRDNTVAPRAGSFHQVRAVLYDGAIASQYDFATLSLDLRKYFPTLPHQAVALRAVISGTSGVSPFDLLPQLGGDALLRGYYGGRFRDQDLWAAQAEYRALAWWRIGVVGFAEVGQVGAELKDFAFDRFRTAVGGGLRFLLSKDEGLNIRADFGWGLDVKSSGFYLNIGEVF